MAEQFPAFKLVTLLARQMSAPIATRIKEAARSHPQAAASRRACVQLGRAYRYAEWRARLFSLALPVPPRAPPVSEQDALNAGADLIGEIIIFGLGAMIIVFEVNRQANKAEDKIAYQKSEWLAVQLQLQELTEETMAQNEQLGRLRTSLQALDPASPASPAIPAAPASQA